MDPLIKQLFERLPPREPLGAGDPRYWNLYGDPDVDLEDPVQPILRSILWEPLPKLHILAGGPGCGRRTEYLRLIALLVQAGRIIRHPMRLALAPGPGDVFVIDGAVSPETVRAAASQVPTIWFSDFKSLASFGETRWVDPLPVDGRAKTIAKSLAHHLLPEETSVPLVEFLENLIVRCGGVLDTIFSVLRALCIESPRLPFPVKIVDRIVAKMRQEILLRGGFDWPFLQEFDHDRLDFFEWPEHEERIVSLAAEGILLCRSGEFSINPLLKPFPWMSASSEVAQVAVAYRAEAPTPALDFDEQLVLKRVRFQQIRLFADLQIELPPAGEDQGQWMVLLGNNAVGKTTILRALTLVLCDRSVSEALLQILGPAAPMIHLDADQGEIEILLEGRRAPLRARLRRDDRGGQQLAERSLPAFSIFAYGCQRGTALGGPERDVEFKALDDVRTLFDPTARLVHAETWLKTLQLATHENHGAAKPFFDAVVETLCCCLPGIDEIDVKSTGVSVRGPNVGQLPDRPIPIGALSDGYLTTMGWLVDLIARWSDRARRLGIPVDGDFRERMTGLVLIDEIDLHLHPLWQVDIVREVRKLFPRMSFIVTTHNPLTILGAQPGEIWVLRRDEEGKVEALQRDLPPGLRADQVLTGEWFGLPSTVDHDTQELLEEHRLLLREGDLGDQNRRQELDAELRERLGRWGDTSVDRMVQSIAAELMPPQVEELSAERRAELREAILKRAREMMAAGAP